MVTVIWLVFHKRSSGKRKYTFEEEEDIINNYQPEPLVEDIEIDEADLKCNVVSGKVGKRISVNGNDCLNLATHNYLGLLEDEEILNEAIKSLRKYGVGSCGPRGFYGTVGL